MRRGQMAGEYLLAVSVLLSIILGVAIPLLQEAEITQATAAARLGAHSFVARNSSLVLTSLNYVDYGANITFTPAVYLNGVRYYGDLDLRYAMLSSISGNADPDVSLSLDLQTACVPGVYKRYCVSVG